MTVTLTRAADIGEILSDLMAQITIENGYLTDIGVSVFRGKQYKEGQQLPCAVLIEGEDRVGDKEGRDAIKITQEYVLGGYVVCDPDNPNDAAHLVLRDLKRCLFPAPVDGRPQTNRLPGTTNAVIYMGRDIGARPAGENVVFAVIYVDVIYVETLWDA